MGPDETRTNKFLKSRFELMVRRSLVGPKLTRINQFHQNEPRHYIYFYKMLQTEHLQNISWYNSHHIGTLYRQYCKFHQVYSCPRHQGDQLCHKLRRCCIGRCRLWNRGLRQSYSYWSQHKNRKYDHCYNHFLTMVLEYVEVPAVTVMLMTRHWWRFVDVGDGYRPSHRIKGVTKI